MKLMTTLQIKITFGYARMTKFIKNYNYFLLKVNEV